MSQGLSCPKCQSEMRSYERNRVLVDQCTGCGGLFLDKGELEALASAENAWHQQQNQPTPAAGAAPGGYPPSQPQQQSYAQPYPGSPSYSTSRQRYAQGHPGGQQYATSKNRYGNQGYGHKRKGSFLGDLFG